MIGVISDDKQLYIIKEFFQLFKTPWELYDEAGDYNVVISTKNEANTVNTKLLIIYGAKKKLFDTRKNIEIYPDRNNQFLYCDNIEIPIYRNISTLKAQGQTIGNILGDSSKTVVMEFATSEQKIIRACYNIFDEIEYLLSVGQPVINSQIPTVELHINMLRNWIINSDVPLVEIPAIPAGFNFITCLTHDVDYVKISHHKFDHTMWGFLYRAIITTALDYVRKRIPLRKLVHNWKAAFTLPFVYLGLYRDFWLQFDRCMEIEQDLKSTFFFIPFKNRSGNNISKQSKKQRATKYDIKDIQMEVKKLLEAGYEIGTHGIDAWVNRAMAYRELSRIREVTSQPNMGIRMHWLCFNENSYRILDDVGFSYDSSFGYNGTVGYRGGTSQVFRPKGVQNILELPLHIQDTALFSYKEMNLCESDAWKICQQLIDNASLYGGVLTVLWHMRSLAPERLWGDFYIKLLKELKARNVWFATGQQAIQWFKKRRDFLFKNIEFSDSTVRIKHLDNRKDNTPPLILRIHRQKHLPETKRNYTDLLLSSNLDETISLN